MKEDYQKAFGKLTLISLSDPFPFNGQNYQNKKRSGTSDQSFFRLRNKFRDIPLFVTYCLWPSLMMPCKAVFDFFQNLHLQIMQANWWHHKLLHFHFRVSHRCWENRGETLQNLMGGGGGGLCQNMGRALEAVKKYLWRSSFDSKLAGYKPASLQICKNELLHTYFQGFS